MQLILWRRRALVGLAAAASAILLASCGGSDSASVPSFGSTTVVVGASLSDTGNTCAFIPAGAGCPPAPPYATGRFSNGPLWVEAVAARYGAAVNASQRGGNNFAFAGARTGSVQAALNAAGLTAVTVSTATGTAPTVPGIAAGVGTTPSQIDALLTRFNFQLSPKTLVVIDATTVGNNISDALTLSQVFPANAAAIGPAVLTGAVTDIVGVINRVYAAGARNILVINVPNVGATPRVTALGGAAVAGATALSQGFNAALAQQITGLRALLSNANIVLFDLYAFEITAKAGTAFTNTTAACFVPPVAPATTPTICTTPATFFYWDSFHPTATTGSLVAQAVIAALPAP